MEKCAVSLPTKICHTPTEKMTAAHRLLPDITVSTRARCKTCVASVMSYKDALLLHTPWDDDWVSCMHQISTHSGHTVDTSGMCVPKSRDLLFGVLLSQDCAVYLHRYYAMCTTVTLRTPNLSVICLDQGSVKYHTPSMQRPAYLQELGLLCYGGFTDKGLCIWDVNQHQHQHQDEPRCDASTSAIHFDKEHDQKYNMIAALNQNKLVSSDAHHGVIVNSISTERISELCTLQLPATTKYLENIHAGHNLVIGASKDRLSSPSNNLLVWDSISASRIAVLPTRIGSTIAISPNDRFLAAMDNAGVVYVWDLTMRRVLYCIDDCCNTVSKYNYSDLPDVPQYSFSTTLRFSSDSTRLVVNVAAVHSFVYTIW